jgi:hypothetical protein
VLPLDELSNEYTRTFGLAGAVSNPALGRGLLQSCSVRSMDVDSGTAKIEAVVDPCATSTKKS